MSTLVRKAYILKTDGTKIELDHQPTLEEAQKAVGGYIEKLTTRLCRTPNLTAFGDDEGTMKGYQINPKASDLLGYYVVGDILILEGWKSVK